MCGFSIHTNKHTYSLWFTRKYENTWNRYTDSSKKREMYTHNYVVITKTTMMMMMMMMMNSVKKKNKNKIKERKT
jgi:hypothetical protein